MYLQPVVGKYVVTVQSSDAPSPLQVRGGSLASGCRSQLWPDCRAGQTCRAETPHTSQHEHHRPEHHLRRAEQRDVHQRAPLQRARRARMRRRRAPAARALPAQEQYKVRER